MTAWLDKILTPWRSKRQATLWYHPRYDAPTLARLAQALGMIALRGKRVLAQLAIDGLVKPGDLKPFPLIPIAELELFHSAAYLERAGRKSTLSRIFGIPEHEVKVDEILGAVRWAVSGTVAATRSVLSGEAPLAVNLGGGFHHAEPNMGSGFCVFNDIGVAIGKAREDGFDKNVVIVDLDFHQGNGNIVGFLDDPTVFNYSLHGAIWTHAEGSGNFNLNFERRIGDEEYLGILEKSLPAFLDAARPGLVYFIAGHDVLDTDPLGHFGLTLAGVERRDRWILDLMAERKLPLVTTLGGGYSAPSCHAALQLTAAALGQRRELRCEEGVENSHQLRKVLAGIDPWDPQFRPQEGFLLSDADLWGDLDPASAPAGLLKDSSAYEVEREMETSGVLEKFRDMGFEDLRVSVDPSGEKILIEARPAGQRSSPLQTMSEIAWRGDTTSIISE